jgi:hypothetical protein
MVLPRSHRAAIQSSERDRLARSPAARFGSESRQAPRAVVGNCHAGDLVARAVWLSSVTNQLRGIPADLVEVGAIRRNPAIARAAGLVASTKRSSGETASQHSPMGWRALVSISTSGPMVILPCASMSHEAAFRCARERLNYVAAQSIYTVAGYLSISRYAIRSFRSSWSGIPGNGMVLPGTAFCGAIMNASRDFSSQTMLEFFMARL